MNQIQTYQELIEWAKKEKLDLMGNKEDAIYISACQFCYRWEDECTCKGIASLQKLISYLKGRIEEIKKDEGKTT